MAGSSLGAGNDLTLLLGLGKNRLPVAWRLGADHRSPWSDTANPGRDPQATDGFPPALVRTAKKLLESIRESVGLKALGGDLYSSDARVYSSDARDSVPQGPPWRRSTRPIELLNGRWHKRARAHPLGSCPTCGVHVVADDQAVDLDGELYHARCSPTTGPM
jgi:hypothetical protein